MNLIPGLLGHLNEREGIVKINVTDQITRHSSLIGDSSNQIGGPYAIPPSNPQKEPHHLG